MEFIYITTFVSMLSVIQTFNVDSQHTYMGFTQGIGNHFGYSVVLQKNDTLLVGAPLANVAGNTEGAVYKCTIDRSGTCSKITVDTKTTTAQENNQRLGLSMAYVKENVLACSPRWHTYTDKNVKKQLWFQGKCSSLKPNLAIDYVENPCQNEFTGNSYFGYCTTGLSSTGTMYRGHPFYVVGLPGAMDSKGVLSVIYRERSFKSEIDRLSDVSSLMGYSVSWGNFDGSDLGGAAGGAPRANELKGLVIVYKIEKTETFSVMTSFENPSNLVGTYFGAAVCAVDVDNDGKDDLLVGAPMFSKFRDEGRMYIYMNRKGQGFVGFERRDDAFDGKSRIGAKFATTVVKIGDINGDGYNDVAVGAPFDGVGEGDQKGAVYIYNGGVSGLHQQYSQVIYASLLRDAPAGFGISISNSVDIDSNAYPDFAVGAYLGDRVYVFKSKPVVTISDDLKTNITFVPPEKENSNCNGPDGLEYHCIEFTVNIQYSGKGIPATFDLEVSVELDRNELLKRAYLIDERSMTTSMKKNVSLTKGKIEKLPVVLYFDVKLQTDVETPIILTTSYTAYEKIGGCGIDVCPVLDSYGKITNSIQVSYLKRCGLDSTCNTDLVLKTDVVFPNHPNEKVLLYGSVYDVNLIANVKNLGEPAYQASMRLNFTSDLEVIGVDINGRPYVLWKETILDTKTKQLFFPIANPLKGGGNETVNVIAKFSVTKPTPSEKSYKFSTKVFSNGVEDKPVDNYLENTLTTKIQTCVRVQGDARPPQITYELEKVPPPEINATVEHVGQEVVFAIYVQNAGKTPVDTLLTEVEIVQRKGKLDIFYIVDMRVDGAQCSKEKLNPLNYTITKQLFAQSLSSPVGKSRRKREIINCRSGNCKAYSCNINYIKPGGGATIFLVARIWEMNVAQMNLPSSQIETVVSVQFGGPEREEYIQKDDCDTTQVLLLELSPSREDKEGDSIAWWIILLCVIGAIILLGVAIAVLYKVGFFKRDRKIKQITGPAQEQHADPDDDDDDDDDD